VNTLGCLPEIPHEVLTLTHRIPAAAATRSDPTDPLSLPFADFTRDLIVNTTSPFLAAQQAAQGFAQLPDFMSRTFIYTGNILNTTIMPPLMDLGVGKSATAHVIQVAAAAYKDRGFKYVPRVFHLHPPPLYHRKCLGRLTHET